MFMEIDFFHMLADMLHYVSGPELAGQRLDFKGEPKDFYLETHTVCGKPFWHIRFCVVDNQSG